MSDIVRMLRVSESDPVQQEAADEIERLEAELADANEMLYGIHGEVCTQGLIEEAENYKQWWLMMRAERDALRALLRQAQNRLVEEGVLYSEPLNARIDAALNKGGGDEPEDK